MEELVFKTLMNDLGEFCIIDFDAWHSIVTGTGGRPQLFDKNTTIEDLNKYYSNFKVDYIIDENEPKFNWQKHIPSDWKLVEVEIKIKSNG